MKRTNLGGLLLLSSAFLFACGGDTSSEPDASVAADAEADMAPDMALPPEGTACSNPTHIETGDLTELITFDTSDAAPGGRDLGLTCGDPNAAEWSPQWVVEYVVPGTGLKAITFSTAVSGTSPYFDTIVQVRNECEQLPTAAYPPSCFDNASSNDVRSTGAVTAQGGETIYLFVTGYGEEARYQINGQPTLDRGPITLTIQVRDNTTPTLSTLAFNRFLDRFELEATGTDANGDVIGAAMIFKNAAGNILDLNGDGRGTASDVYAAGFVSSLNGMTSFSGRMILDANIGTYLLANNAASVEAQIIDGGYALSEVMTAASVTLTEVSVGETCNDALRCLRPLTCNGDSVCEVPAPVQAACDAATVIEQETPAPDTTTESTAATINSSSTTLFQSRGCTNSSTITAGPEKIFSLTIPETGTYDLIAGTDNSGTASNADTVLYVRSSCAIPTDEIAMGCSDDVDSEDVRSHVELRNLTGGGTYTIIVEPYQALRSSSFTFTLSTKLRPVIGTGELCDRAQLRNRCATGTCPSGSGAVCP